MFSLVSSKFLAMRNITLYSVYAFIGLGDCLKTQQPCLPYCIQYWISPSPIISQYSQFQALVLSEWSQAVAHLAQCSRINRNPNFIVEDFFHFSSFIHNGDNLNLQEKMKFHGEILKNLRFCEKKIFCHEFCIIHL